MKISVILTAFNRKNFIQDALLSILKQEFDFSSFELIVITNFDFELPTVEKELIIKHIVMEGTIGEYLFQGITNAKYEIIAFLDDDDLWDSNRLADVSNIFEKYRDVTFYHNSQVFIDRFGTKIERKVSNPLKDKDKRYIDANRSLKTISSLVSAEASFNLSSIVIHRSILQNRYEVLKDITANPDGFFFWNNLLYGSNFYITSRKLTSYRLHSANRSLDTSIKKRTVELVGQRRTLKVLQSHFNTYRSQKNYRFVNIYLELQIVLWSAQIGILKNESRKDYAKILHDILKFWPYWRDFYTWRILIYSLSYFVHDKFYLILFKNFSLDGTKSIK